MQFANSVEPTGQLMLKGACAPHTGHKNTGLAMLRLLPLAPLLLLLLLLVQEA
jgi:hypothetical protein